MTRPAFIPPADVPPALQAAMIAASRRRWCFVAPDGSAFFVISERKARGMLARDGGAVFPPEVQ